jgi:hypothetical protein
MGGAGAGAGAGGAPQPGSPQDPAVKAVGALVLFFALHDDDEEEYDHGTMWLMER